MSVAAAQAQAANTPCVDIDTASRSTGAQPRTALVIGNAKYASLSYLETPVNDAEDVAKALSLLGFKVRRCRNVNLDAMRDELDRFSKDLRPDRNPNALAVFYFAGHGLRGLGDSNGHNFLLPVEFDVDEGRDRLRERAIWLHRDIIKAMPRRRTRDRGASVIILDACREDEVGRHDGLWQVDPEHIPNGTLIAFSARPGEASTERTGLRVPERHSVYTKQLLKQLAKVGPDTHLVQFFEGVRGEVCKASNEGEVCKASDEGQVPRVMAKLADNGILLAAETARTSTTGDEGRELALWRWAKDSPALCAFEEYLARFPNGQFAALAGDKLQKISQRQAAERLVAPQLPEAVRKNFEDKWAAEEDWCDDKLSEKVSELKEFPKNHPNRVHDDQGRARLRLPQSFGARGPREKRRNGYVRRPARVQACQDMQRANPFNALWRLPRGYASGKRCPRAGERTAKPYQQAGWSPELAAWQARTACGVRAAVRRQGIDHAYPDRLSGYRRTGIAGAQTLRVGQRDWGPPSRRSMRPPVAGRDGLRGNVGDKTFQEDLVKAAQGNVDAMYRLALAYEERGDTNQMLRWLLVSSAMGNGIASYKLGRYYAARRGGYFSAVIYRSRARHQGYTPPVGLREER